MKKYLMLFQFLILHFNIFAMERDIQNRKNIDISNLPEELIIEVIKFGLNDIFLDIYDDSTKDNNYGKYLFKDLEKLKRNKAHLEKDELLLLCKKRCRDCEVIVEKCYALRFLFKYLINLSLVNTKFNKYVKDYIIIDFLLTKFWDIFYILVHQKCTAGIKFLLDSKSSKINVNQKYDNITYLMVACINNDLELIKLLLSHNALINETDQDGYTCLMQAIGPKIHRKRRFPLGRIQHPIFSIEGPEKCYCHICSMKASKQAKKLEVVKLLISFGANFKIINFKGQTALDIAKNYNMREITKYLMILEDKQKTCYLC